MSVLRFLLKSKARKSKDKNEGIETAAAAAAAPASGAVCRPPSPPGALLPTPSPTAEGPVQIPGSRDRLEKQLSACTPATSALPDRGECEVEQSSLSAESGEHEGEEAGPSGLYASSSATSTFIPFSGGGQRLGGPSPREEPSPAPCPSAPGAAVDSPKAKKAKSSRGSSTQVSAVTSSGLRCKENASSHVKCVSDAFW